MLGCSLFSHIPQAEQEIVGFKIRDFYHIEKWIVETHNEAHIRDLAWLNATVEALEKEQDVDLIILTHWSPSTDPRAVDPAHA